MSSPTTTLFSILLLLSLISATNSRLSSSYYSKSCPQFTTILHQITTQKQHKSPATAGAALRLFFHDCFVTGCDGSALITSTSSNTAERDADINRSLPGDGFDVVIRAKTALELSCPNTVSCADILAAATRNLVAAVGGPYYPLLFGRKDGLVSRSSLVFPDSLPRPNMTMDQMIDIFAKHNFSAREMVALSGGHTIGFSHCSEFSKGVFNYSPTQKFDPTYNPRLAQALSNACKKYKTQPDLSVFNDVMTPSKFDNVYFQNLPKGFGILSSDRVLYVDPRTRPFVEMYARDESVFFDEFGKAMEKLSRVGVKTGRHGEIRRRCDAFNNA